MNRAIALALVIGAMIWMRLLGVSTTAASAGTALVLGFVLIGAWLAGDALRWLRMPRLTGYLLFGVAIGPYAGNLITGTMASQLQVVAGIATTLIALIAGLTLSVERLGPRFAPIARFTAMTVLLPLAMIFAVAWAAWPWLPIDAGAMGLSRVAMALLLAVMIVSFSPTMTAAVITDTAARGRLSQLVLAVVVMADLVLLVFFALTMQLARVVLNPGGNLTFAAVAARVAWESGGAIAFGSLVGALFALYLRYVSREVPLVLLGVCALLSQVGSVQQFEPLLAAMAAGLVIENLSVAQGDALRTAVRQAAPPVLVVFFVAVGAALRLDAVAATTVLIVAVVVLRLAAIRLGVAAGLRLSGLDPEPARHVWTGLVSQAGITLGFAAVAANEFGAWAMQVQVLLVGAIAINELIGPVVFRRGLSNAGDLDEPPPRPLFVVSNREPYLHVFQPDGSIAVKPATGGVAVALDALMRERGGVWVAHGAGEADHAVVDVRDRVSVPPDQPAYVLRRLWIDDAAFAAYYGGYANEGLWPLCHQVDVRPRFRGEDWAAYRQVNEAFAAAIDHELGDLEVPVFIQDYHLALVAPALRARRPQVRTALFWHIPWPYPDRLRICPQRTDLLAGLLANDLVAFQVERDRRNFLMAVDEWIEAEIDEEASSVHFEGRKTTVVAVPIGVDFDRIQAIAADIALPTEQCRLQALLGLRAEIVGLGVDRLDYTKGIPERLMALDKLVTRRPDLRGRLTFVQIGVPSRSQLESYASVEAEIARIVADLNRRHTVNGVPLVAYHTLALGAASLVALYRLARFCVVSSLHDGMNLVAKEFVAARDDEQGVLVLSALAGAAQELDDALIVNPYDLDGFADALAQAVDMPPLQQAYRMRAMRQVVAGQNVFLWASDILDGLESLWTKPLVYSVRGWEETSV
jgi:trehalose 6-phosphate synthase